MIRGGAPVVGVILSFGLLAQSVDGQESTAADLIEQGRRIYLDGVLPTGGKLTGVRFDSTKAEGQDVACVKCHRPSGMGGIEGNVQVLPVSAPFLFSREQRPLALLDTRSPRDITRAHPSYTAETLAKAVIEGTNVQGKTMNRLMPRYALQPDEMKALTAYLRQLSDRLSPGVTQTTVKFATITTPEVDAKRREVMLQMMRGAFQQRNYSQRPRSGQMRMPLEMIPHEQRSWELAVWELNGKPDTWAAQLEEKYRKEPVFAVVSGYSDSSWAPISGFCQQQQLPCLFPSTPLPGSHSDDFYSLFFSNGVELDAEVLAKFLESSETTRPRRVVQVRSADTVSQAAAGAFLKTVNGSGIEVKECVFDSVQPGKCWSNLSTTDAVAAWLSPKELDAMKKSVQSLNTTTYFSARLGKQAVSDWPVGWRPKSHLVYPYELGEKREKNLKTLKQWLQSYGYPLIDENFQAEVFFNLLLLTDLSMQMLDNYYRDYLIERAEDMLGQGTNASSYPRLGIGVGQRFASKGAYIAHFDKAGQLAAESEWIVP